MTNTAFRPLPQPTNADGDPRLTGVEIELGGLPEDQVAAIVAKVLNGTAHQDDTTIRAEEHDSDPQSDVCSSDLMVV